MDTTYNFQQNVNDNLKVLANYQPKGQLGNGTFEWSDVGAVARNIGGSLVGGVLSTAEALSDPVLAAYYSIMGQQSKARDTYLNSWSQTATNYLRGDDQGGETMQFINSIAQGVGEQGTRLAISLGLAAITGGVVNPAVTQNVLLGASAFGGGMQNAVQTTGELGLKEHVYGIGAALIEFGTEKLSDVAGLYGGSNKTIGGVLGLLNVDDWTSKLLGQYANTVGGKLARTFMGEFGEEALSEILDVPLSKLTIDENASTSLKDVLSAGLQGGIVGAIMGGGQEVLNKSNYTKRGNDIINNNLQKEVLQEGLEIGNDYATYLQNRINAGAEVSPTQYGKLAYENQEKIMKTEVEDIKNKYDLTEKDAQKKYYNELAAEIEYATNGASAFLTEETNTPENINAIDTYVNNGGSLDDLEVASRLVAKSGNNVNYVYVPNGIEGTTTNGNTITINLTSNKFVSTVAVHEALHTLSEEKTMKMYEAITTTDWYKQNYQKIVEQYEKAYEGRENSDTLVKEEVVARFLEQSITNPRAFLKSLEGKSGISDEIVAYFKGYNKYKKNLSKADKKSLNTVYNEYLEGLREEKSEQKIVGEKYMIVEDEQGNKFVRANRQVLSGNNPSEWRKQITKYINDEIRKGNDVRINTLEGDDIYITENTAGKGGFWNAKLSKNKYKTKLNAEAHIDELIKVSNTQIDKQGNKKIKSDIKNHYEKYGIAKDGFSYRNAYFEDFDGQLYKIQMSVSIDGDVEAAYNIGALQKKNAVAGGINPNAAQRAAATASSNNNNAQNLQNVNTFNQKSSKNSQNNTNGKKYSLPDTDSEGRKLTEAQREFFADSKVVDDVARNYENGGQDFENKISRLAEQIETEEDVDYEEAKEIAKKRLEKGSNLFEVYLNIKNPAYVGGEYDTPTTLFEDFFDYSDINEEDFDSEDDYWEAREQYEYEAIDEFAYKVNSILDAEGIDNYEDYLLALQENGVFEGVTVNQLKDIINESVLDASDQKGNYASNEVARAIIEALGYDGIIDNTVVDKFGYNSGRYSYMEGIEDDTRHYIAFYPEQIKLVDNENPTADKDIRYSLSEINGKKVVVVDTDQDIFEGKDKYEIRETARDYIKERYQGKKIEGIKFTNDSTKEYVYSKYSKKLISRDEEKFTAKMKASTELEAFIESGEFVRHEEAKHSHLYNKGGYNRYKVSFIVDDMPFTGEMVVAIGSDGKGMFYDIVKIKEGKDPRNGQTNATADRDLASNKDYAQNSENVKGFDENNTNGTKFSFPEDKKVYTKIRYSLSEKDIDKKTYGGYNGNGYYYEGYTVSEKEQTEKRRFVESLNDGFAKKQLKKSPMFNDLSLNDVKTLNRVYNGEILSYEELSKLDIVKKAQEYNLKSPKVLKNDATPTSEQLTYFNEINERFLESVKDCSKERKACIIVGLPSSGKSSAIASSLLKKYNAFELDNDTIKSLMDEFDNGKGANSCQNASSYISDNLSLPTLIDDGVNLIIPIVGKSTNAIENKYAPLVDAGYEVELYNVTLPKEKALNRATTRFVETGRFVDIAYIQSIDIDKINNAYDTAKNWEGITKYGRFNNDVPFGQKAISEETGGRKRLDRKSQAERIWNNQSGEGRNGRTSSSGVVDRRPDNKRNDIRYDGVELVSKTDKESGDTLFSLSEDKKVYTKASAKRIFNDIVESELKGKYHLTYEGKKGLSTELVYEVFNNTTEGKKLQAATDIAEYFVQRAVFEDAMFDEADGEVLNVNYFKTAARELFSEAEYNNVVENVANKLVEAYDANGKKDALTRERDLTRELKEQIKELKERVKDVRVEKDVSMQIQAMTQSSKEFARRKYSSQAFSGEEAMAINDAFSKAVVRDKVDTDNVIKAVNVAKNFYTPERINGVTDGVTNETGLYLQSIANDIAWLSETLETGTSMTTEQLVAFNKVMKAVTHVFKNIDTIIYDGKRRNTAEIGQKIINEQRGLPKVGKYFKQVRFFAENACDPLAVFNLINGYNDEATMIKLFNDIRDGETKMVTTKLDVMREFNEFGDKNKKYAKRLGTATIEMTVEDRATGETGTKNIPIDIAMQLYLTSKRVHAQEGLYKAGFTFTDKEGYHRYLPTESSMKELYDNFTEDDKNYMEIAHKFFNKTCRDIKVTKDNEIYGFSNVEEGNDYIPIRRDDGIFSSPFNFSTYMRDFQAVNSLSMNKNTVKGTKSAISMQGLSSVVNVHAQQISLYNGLYEPIMAFSKVWDRNVTGKSTDVQSVKLTVKERTGDSNIDMYVSDLLRGIQGNNKVPQSKMISWLRSSYAKFQLGANIKTMAIQTSSYPMAMIYIKPKNLAKAIKPTLPKATVYKYCPFLEVRATDNQFAKAQGVIDDVKGVGDILLKPIGVVDDAMTRRIFEAACYEVAEGTNREVFSDANMKEAAILAEKTVRNTQSNALTSEKTAMMRSGSDLVKSLVMFSSDASKQLSRIADSIGQYYFAKRSKNENKIKEAKNAVTRSMATVTTSVAACTLIGLLVKHALGREDDEKTFMQEYVTDFFGQMTAMVPIMRDAYTFFTDGYEVSNFAVDTVNNVYSGVNSSIKMLNRVINGEDLTDDEIVAPLKKVLFAAGQISGIPTRNLVNQPTYFVKKWFLKEDSKQQDALFGSSPINGNMFTVTK